jgi:small-conductance mechanosensitive channel
VDIPALVSEQRSLLIFLLFTVALGGSAAWLTGRAIAATWRPWWHVVAFVIPIGAAVRFLHFVLFHETLLTLQYYLVDTTVCLIFGLIGFRLTRVVQMVTSYGWINERTGAFRWRRRADASESG